MNSTIFPSVFKTIDGTLQACNLVSVDLTSKRTIYLTGEINDTTALNIITQLRYLSDRSESGVSLIINSPGGSVPAGLAILDCCQSIPCEITTVAIGCAYSMAAVLLACCGKRSQRYATANCSVMIHQPYVGSLKEQQATEICLLAAQIREQKERIVRLLSQHTGKKLDVLLESMERDKYMSAQQARDFGLVDHVGFPASWLGNN